MRTSVSALLLVTLVACGCSGKAKGSADPGSASASGSASGSAPAPAPAPISLEDLGAKCGDAGACPAGLECVSYYGIAGASGPQFTSCEKKCAADTDCPDGSKCATVADGPGHVCRK
jgi:hypothetical protein